MREERLVYAIDLLREEAFKWWVQEEDDRRFYKEPTIKTWRALKEAMRHEFAPEFTSSEIKELYPRRYPTHGSKEARKVVAQESKRGCSQQANLQPSQGHTIVQCLDQKSDIPKAMESRSNVKTGPEVQQDPNSTSLFESKVHKELFPRNKEILDLKEEDTSSQGIKEQELKREDPVYQHGIAKEEEAIRIPDESSMWYRDVEERATSELPLFTITRCWNISTGDPHRYHMSRTKPPTSRDPSK
ncbi:uncharacterized protein LOC130500902 [Raphanus sativus]|uniref:Uncharacterized protein LOC130500902 n=1 Tax=Raphanus sativus TaxID=3726 RepID=A0A9W3CJV3_RAPSA|nr:uncharacterized protein LOC130500902 [Raphanus sativus]